MKKVLESFLFDHHILVGHQGDAYPDVFETVFSLAGLFGIRILKGQEMACRHMLQVAGEKLGIDVPEPFYRYFPKSVRNLTKDQADYDRLRQYMLSYGMGAGTPAGQPYLEERFASLAFRENTEIRDFSILSQEEADAFLKRSVNHLLLSSRPLREDQYQVVLAYLTSHDYMPDRCGCKDTAIRLLLDTRDARFSDFIQMSDFVRMAEILQDRRNRETEKNVLITVWTLNAVFTGDCTVWDAVRLWKLTDTLQKQSGSPEGTPVLEVFGGEVHERYSSGLPAADHLPEIMKTLKNKDARLLLKVGVRTENPALERFIKKQELRGKDAYHLHLRRRDKQLINRVMDYKLSRGKPDIESCCEKRRALCGLLSHTHYAPETETAKRFAAALWKGPNLSVNSSFESALRKGEAAEAADILLRGKGAGAVARSFRCILSRCKTAEEVSKVCDCLVTDKPVLLIQMLMLFDEYGQFRDESRVFRFVRMNTLRVHREKECERLRRRSYLPEELIDEIPFMLRRALEKRCLGTLGKVYLDPAAADLPLPLQESVSSGGYGVLPRGSVFHLDRRQTVRVFIYWESVPDVNLAGVALTRTGGRVKTFNWQNFVMEPWNGIVYSGDQTSGVSGGSEYMDVDLQMMAASFPDARYLVMEANVYTHPALPHTFPLTFDGFECRAGFMQRDRISSGDVFEPKTVKTNFRITGGTSHSCLFALDLKEGTLIWLNINTESGEIVPISNHQFLLPYLKAQKIMNMYDFFCILARELTDDPMEADVIVSDDPLPCRESAEIIHTWDSGRILGLMNPSSRGKMNDAK